MIVEALIESHPPPKCRSPVPDLRSFLFCTEYSTYCMHLFFMQVLLLTRKAFIEPNKKASPTRNIYFFVGTYVPIKHIHTYATNITSLRKHSMSRLWFVCSFVFFKYDTNVTQVLLLIGEKPPSNPIHHIYSNPRSPAPGYMSLF